MRQHRILRENAQRHIEHPGLFGNIVQGESHLAARNLHLAERHGADDLHDPVRLHGTGHDQFGPHVLRSESGQVEREFEMVTAPHEDRLVSDPGALHIHDLHAGPGGQHLVFPSDERTGGSEIIFNKLPLAGCQPVIEAHLVVAQHPVGREVGSDLGDTFLDRSHPRVRNTVGTPVVVFRSDLLFDRVVNHLGVEFVLVLLIGKYRLHRQRPTGALLVPLDPPAVEHRKLQHAVHHTLFARRARGFERPGRGVEPHVHALHQATRQLHVVILQEDDLAGELRHGCDFDDPLDEILSRLIVGMRLARKDKLHGTLLVVDDGRQAIQIGEEQQRPFVSGETARKTDLQHIGLDALEHLHDLMGRIHAHLPGIAVAAADQANELLFEHHALLPKVFVRDVVHLLPLRNTIFVPLEPFGKIAGIQTTQARRRPGREVHTVGHVTDMQLVFEVARP